MSTGSSTGISKKTVLFVDINNANDEFNHVTKNYSGWNVVRVPNLKNINPPELASFLIRRQAKSKEVETFCSRAKSAAAECAASQSQLKKIDDDIKETFPKWNLDEQIAKEIKQLNSGINSVYVSSHYNGADGYLKGDWGSANLTSLSDLVEKDPHFKDTKHVSLLACFYSQPGLIEKAFPVSQKKDLVVTGYSLIGPFSNNPESAKVINNLSEIDRTVIQNHGSTRPDLLNSSLAKYKGNRKLGVVFNSGKGEGQSYITNKPNSADLKFLPQGLKSEASACGEMNDNQKSWVDRLSKSTLTSPSPDNTSLMLNSIVDDYSKLFNDTKAKDCLNSNWNDKLGRTFAMFQNYLEIVNQDKELSLFNLSNEEKDKLNLILKNKNQSLKNFIHSISSLKNEIQEKLSSLIKNHESYDNLKIQSSDLLYVSLLEKKLGIESHLTSRLKMNSHPDEILMTFVQGYKADLFKDKSKERLVYLQGLLDEIKFKNIDITGPYLEFGKTRSGVIFQIKNEIDLMKESSNVESTKLIPSGVSH